MRREPRAATLVTVRIRLDRTGGLCEGYQREMWDELSRAEQPVRELVIYLGKYEVTQAQWTAAMGTWPWVAKEHVALGEDRPAVYVSWRDAQDFVRRLNE